MKIQLLITRSSNGEIRIAFLEDGLLEETLLERRVTKVLGNIYQDHVTLSRTSGRPFFAIRRRPQRLSGTSPDLESRLYRT